MPDAHPSNHDESILPVDEKTKIRAEMRYAMLAARESLSPTEKKSSTDKFLSFFNNGLTLLLIGSTITYFLVPNFQRKYEDRKQRAVLMQECLSKFMAYSNSIWKEYYLIQPLSLETKISKERYLKYLSDTSEIKFNRYNAYDSAKAISVVFQESPESNRVEKAMNDYAVTMNQVSIAIENFAKQLYCTPENFEKSKCEDFDPKYKAYDEYMKIHDHVIEVANSGADKVAGLMVEKLSNISK